LIHCISAHSGDFNVHRFRALLTTHTLGSGVIYLREVDSTMTVSQQVEQFAPSGTIILAEAQTAGKGREQRPWLGKPCCNLYFTLVLRLPPQDLTKLNFAACLAIAQASKDFGVRERRF
jgi:BirA family biotin operon repressor/biotin-[acetyl-CoA-carboxylase] ligase